MSSKQLRSLLLMCLVIAGCGGEEAGETEPRAAAEPTECVEPSGNPVDGTYSVLARSAPMESPDAPTPARARFTDGGGVLVVDPTFPRVFETSRALEEFRPVGGPGPGPGEYEGPVDAVRGPEGTYVVLDRGSGSLVIYGPDGAYRREIRLWPGAWALAADETAVYVSSWLVPTRYDGSGPGPPVLARVHLDGEKARVDTLLRYRSEWRGGPPMWNLPGALTYPRVGRDGELYLAWEPTYEIWRIEEDGPTVVVRGCIPDELVEGYRDASGDRRAIGTLVADFAVRPNGDVILRGGYAGPDGRVHRQRFSAEGELMESWALTREDSLFSAATLDPEQPDVELSWSRGSGELRLLRFREEGGG